MIEPRRGDRGGWSARTEEESMLRDRMLRRRWLVSLIVAWGIGIAALPPGGEALPPLAGEDGSVADESWAARGALERRLIRDRLNALGVSAADTEAVLERLSPEERAEMAARAGELDAGGDSGVAILAIAILIGMIAILVLELLGRRVISRP
jgi:hypothetical protein